MTPSWFRAVSAFAAFNLIAVPIAGTLAWGGMLRLNADGALITAVAVSLAVAGGILAVNCLLCRWAKQTGLPKLGELVLWLVTGLTFILPIGTGQFSPVNFLLRLMG